MARCESSVPARPSVDLINSSEEQTQELHPFVLAGIQQLKSQESILIQYLSDMQADISEKLEYIKSDILRQLEQMKTDITAACSEKSGQWRTASDEITKARDRIHTLQRLVGAFSDAQSQIQLTH